MNDLVTTDGVTTIFKADYLREEFGVIRMEEWPEGLVLWVDGQIRWKSWEDPDFKNRRRHDAR